MSQSRSRWPLRRIALPLTLLLARGLAGLVPPVFGASGERSELSGVFQTRLDYEDAAVGEGWWEFRSWLRPTLRSHLGPNSLHLTADASYTESGQTRSSDTGASFFRAYLELPGPRADYRVGKQAIHWGSARIWNPTDVFSQYGLVLPWDVRQGVYALRCNTRTFDRFDTVLVLGWPSREAVPDEGRIWIARFAFTSGITDIALSTSFDSAPGTERWGLDVRSDVGDRLGVAFEMAVSEKIDGHWYGEYVLRLDKTFRLGRRSLLAGLQYYRDGSGGKRVEDYDLFGLEAGRRYSLADHYFSLDLDVEFRRQTRFTCYLIRNGVDESMRLIPYVTRTLQGRHEFVVGAEFGRGSWGELRPAIAERLIGRNLLPSTYYAFYRRYF